MSEYVPLFTEYYKVKFLYKTLVFQKTHEQYSNEMMKLNYLKELLLMKKVQIFF